MKKYLYMEKIFQKDNKITMLRLTFLREKNQQLSTKEPNKLLLSLTVFYFFRFLNESAKLRGMKNKVNVYTTDNSLQSLHTDYCGTFQLYFYSNLFEPLEGIVVACANELSLHQTSRMLT